MLVRGGSSRREEKSKIVTFHVKEEAILSDFVAKKIGSMSKTALKRVLSRGQVFVNNQVKTQYDYALRPGDVVAVDFAKEATGLKSSRVSVLFEDDYLVVVNKSEGVLSVATDKQEDYTAFRVVLNHLKKQSRSNRLYVVHRLDRETSGVLIFAKQKEAQMLMQRNWQRDVKSKVYYAIVEGVVEKDSGEIRTWLNEDPKSKKVYSSDFDNGGMESVTRYEVVRRLNGYTFLKVLLLTGRKNQIRVHMQSIGHPIIGDKKYGGSTSPIGRIGLHASSITFRHPITTKLMTFEAELPEKMARFVHK